MKEFMGKDFLLDTGEAKRLFRIASEEPIFDYHCHLIPREIAENASFTTITDAWLGGDHYKWRAMRACGISEDRITGKADPYDKFLAWAETMENLIGNPLYHWTHLELQRYFGITEPLSRKSAKAIYDKANDAFKTDKSLTVWGIMEKFNVYAVGTTDDPADDLRWHKKIREDKGCPALVMPSFRPDKALNIEKPEFTEYIKKLSEASGVDISDFSSLVAALEKRLDFFVEMGCKASDHALKGLSPVVPKEGEADEILERRLRGEPLSAEDGEKWRVATLSKLAAAYKKNDVAMQLHFASIRDNNPRMYASLGPDTGYDASYDTSLSDGVSSFFSSLSAKGEVPKTIFYSLNPKDYYPLATLMGCWQGEGIRGKMQLGSAWWFCDHKEGMEEQMKTLAATGLLPLFIGMLTDSRSFLSYPRHEYFRRILCAIIGKWVENGEIPDDKERNAEIVRNISFRNAKSYFGA